MSGDRKWPVVTDLPVEERQPFTDWLYGQHGHVTATAQFATFSMIMNRERWKAVLRGEPDWMD